MLIPNLKIKLRNKAPMKSYFKKLAKQHFFENYFLCCLFLNFAFGFGISVCKILRLLVPMYIDLFKEKSFQL